MGFPWSRYRTQIVVTVVAVAAIALVFLGGSAWSRTTRSVAGMGGAGSAATGLDLGPLPGGPRPAALLPGGIGPSPVAGGAVTGAGAPAAGAPPAGGQAAGGTAHGAASHGTSAGTSPVASASLGPVPGTAPEPVSPTVFAQGACVAYPPVNGNRNVTVFLDAGHGGQDPGGVGETEHWRTITEAWVNLRVEMAAMTQLTQQGYRVVVSRSGPGLVHPAGPADSSGGLLTPLGVRADIAARDICANMSGASLLIGIYMNAGYWGGGAVTAYCADRSFGASNRRFASILQTDVLHQLNSAGYGIPNLGLQTDDQLGSSTGAAADSYGHLMLLGPAKSGYFSTPSRMPGALIEPLFLTDPFEASVAASSRGQGLVATGITHAVIDYFASPG